MRRKIRNCFAALVLMGLIFGASSAFGASMKYVGIHYFSWYHSTSPWNQSWGLNSNVLYFEPGTYSGFTLTGTAFGSAPRSTTHGSLSGWEGTYWADSYTGGETATGTLRSSNFTLINNETFRFKAAGYDGQAGTSNSNYFYLRRASDNAVLFSAKPPQRDTFTWITWDTSSYSGTSVYFEAVDNHTGSGYAWLAVDGQDPIIPTIGRYNSTQAVGQSHGQTFKNMGIDFAFVDNTNNTIWGSGNASNPTDYIWDNTKATADGFAQVIGGPKVAALLSITSWDGPSTQVQRLFKNYAVAYPWIPTNAGDLFLQKVGMVYNELGYNSAKYFYYEGKPLLGLYVAPAATVYDENDVDQTATTGKLPDSWNPVIPNTGGQTIRQLFTIRWVGAFINGSGNPKYVASTGDTLKAFRGHWSWEDGTPQSWASRANSWGDTPEAVTVSPYARNPIQGRNNGITFRDMWYRAFDVDPLISVIHTWNEFASSGDEFSIENSQSIEPTTLYYKDTYKNLAQNYITHFKKSRMDIGLYDSFGRQIYFKNRKNDYSGYTFEFGHETSYSMDRGSGVESLSGDFDGNGRTDIALRNIADGTIAIRYSPFFTVESSGGQPGEKVVTLESGSRYKAFVGDFNGDGKADIGFYDSVGGGGPGFIIRYNDGNSNFGTVYTWAWSLSGSYQYGSAKINNDGRWDIVYRDPSTGTISFAFANSDGLQTKPTSIYTYSWASGTHYQLMTGDANSDNYGDIGVRDTSNGAIFMRENFKNSTGSTWNFGNEKGMVWASGSHYLPITGDFR